MVEYEADTYNSSGVADSLGVKYYDGSAKSVGSMVNKVVRKAAKNYTLAQMKDHTRTHIELESFSQIEQLYDELYKRGIDFNAEALHTEFGYVGLHLTWINSDGTFAEMQVSTKEHWKTKLAGDIIYDRWRNDEQNILSGKRPQFEVDAYLADLEKSKKMWADAIEQNHIPDFKPYSKSSSSVNGVASNNSVGVALDTGVTSLPSINSLNERVSKSMPMMAPDSSLTKSIHSLPSPDINIISQKLQKRLDLLENLIKSGKASDMNYKEMEVVREAIAEYKTKQAQAKTQEAVAKDFKRIKIETNKPVTDRIGKPTTIGGHTLYTATRFF